MLDVTEWITPEQWKMRYQAAELSGDVGEDGYRLLGAAVDHSRPGHRLRVPR